LSVLLVVGVIVLSRLIGSDSSPPSPVALVAVDAPQAGSAECATLVGALPAELPSGSTVLRRLPRADPATPAISAISSATTAALPTSVWIRMYAWTTARPFVSDCAQDVGTCWATYRS